MKVQSCLAILLLALAPAGNAVDLSCPAPQSHNSYECAKYLEGKLAAAQPGLFVRSGQGLIVKLANGREAAYADSDKDDVDGVWYNFIAHYAEIGYGLIAAQYYEGGSRLLLDLRTGAATEIHADPVLSPDRQRIAVGNYDESGYTPNLLAVYRLDAAGPAVEFSQRDMDWGVGELQWVSGSELTFVQFRHDSTSPYLGREPKRLRSRAAVKGGARTWAVE